MYVLVFLAYRYTGLYTTANCGLILFKAVNPYIYIYGLNILFQVWTEKTGNDLPADTGTQFLLFYFF